MQLKIRFQNSEAQGIDFENLCSELEICASKGDGFSRVSIIKDDKTTTLFKVDSAIGVLMVKRYNTKNVWHLLRRNFQRSRAKNCLRMSNLFITNGLNVAEPLAVVENSIGLFKGRSWYITRFVQSDMLIDYLDAENWKLNLKKIEQALYALFEVLLKQNLSHGDMKATNLLVSNNNLVVIDLDAAKHHHFMFFHRHAIRKDKARFLKNWNSLPELREYFEQKLDGMNF